MIKQEDKRLKLSNPEKLLWPEEGITKAHYVKYLNDLAPYLLEYTKDRVLTTIHYPDGYNQKSYFQKNIPSHAPNWINKKEENDIEYIVMDSLETLLWLGNMAALEFHIPFNLNNYPNHPWCLVFDLDPSKGQTFSQVVEAALIIHDTLNELGINSFCKTSGASGIQIMIATGGIYNYQTARELNEFFGQYFSSKHPKLFTIERLVKNRGTKLYFDYLQMWTGKTIIAPYSPRATKAATVSAPVEWQELKKNIKPEDFTLHNIISRLKVKGDILKPLLKKEAEPGLRQVLEWFAAKK